MLKVLEEYNHNRKNILYLRRFTFYRYIPFSNSNELYKDTNDFLRTNEGLELLLGKLKKLYNKTGIICLKDFHNRLRKIKKDPKLSKEKIKIQFDEVFMWKPKKCNKFSHLLSEKHFNRYYVLKDYQNINGIIEIKKWLSQSFRYPDSILVEQYELCKRFGEQSRVDWLDLCDDVKYLIKRFL